MEQNTLSNSTSKHNYGKAKKQIVEDEAIIAMEIDSQLQGLGYEVTSIVDTGKKAIEKAEEEKPDLILMDIRIKDFILQMDIYPQKISKLFL